MRRSKLNIDKIISLYTDGYSQTEIAKIFSCSQTNVSKILLRRDIYGRKGRPRKYIFNENFFEVWSEHMAYILGFTAADGNVYESTLSFKIHSADVEILKYIVDNIGYVPIEENKKDNYVRIRFNSTKIVKSLLQYGITPNKSLNLNMNLETLPEEYIGDFIRGVFDGDGSITIHPSGGLHFAITSASEKFINQLYSLMKNQIGTIRKRIYTTKQNQFEIYGYRKNSLKFKEFIYSNENFSLKRKRIIFFQH